MIYDILPRRDDMRELVLAIRLLDFGGHFGDWALDCAQWRRNGLDCSCRWIQNVRHKISPPRFCFFVFPLVSRLETYHHTIFRKSCQ